MSQWVLLLGGSTGHGAATAKRLAKDGYGIIAFHFDRGEAKKIAEEMHFHTPLPSQLLLTMPFPSQQQQTCWWSNHFCGGH